MSTAVVDEQVTSETPEDDFGAGILDGDDESIVNEDAVSEEPAAEAEVQETVEQETATPTFADRLSELGFEGIDSDEAGRDRLLEAYVQQREQAVQQDARLRHLETLAEYGQQHLAGLQKQTSEATPEIKTDSDAPLWPQYPELDEVQLRRYRQQVVGENGVEEKWAEGTPAELRAAWDNFNSTADKWTNDLAYRPEQTLGPIVEKLAEQVAGRLLDERLGMDSDEFKQRSDLSGDQAYRDQFEERYSKFLFDANPVTGEPDYGRPNSLGMRAQQTMREAQELYGIDDPVKQLRYAERVMEHDLAAAAGRAESATAQTTAAERRREKRRRGVLPDSSGSVARDVDETQNDNLTAGQELVAVMKANGDL